MDSIILFYELLQEQVRLMKNLLKAFQSQQKALVKNDVVALQESTLQQADLIEAIARLQDKLYQQLEVINKNHGVNLPHDSFQVLRGKVDEKMYKKIFRLIDLQKVYGMEIEEHQKNNQILIENALKFVQDHMELIVSYLNQKPTYDDGRRRSMQPVNHLLNKKL